MKSLSRAIGRAQLAALAIIVLFAVREALAHAIVLEEFPAQNSVVTGPDVAMKLRFNVRIDASRSRLLLYLPDGSTRELQVKPQSAPDVLAAHAQGLLIGSYKLHWLALAADGHITQGDIQFRVQNP